MMCASSSWLLLLLLLCVVVAAAADNSLQQQCTESTSSLTPCMDYGSGSSDRPNSDCCDTVRNIRGTNPVCLCYAVQQTHNCSSPWSTLGLKVERLLMLAGACNLDNSNASNCNALLNLSPTSPDYSIFTNTTQASNSSCDVSVSPSKASMHQINICVTFAIGLAMATFLS
ncbi:non-specific lipid transfer protein GPI-anchored 1-like [Zingiber officinale]|uniref:non-specific lipid transfer protein GPI-anchored 1-like n=1 Tax=Zingiber officinale TaxID=94328 RepID=UPI001C4AEE5E|nr:non-specific lipid transfer protein GPI-anchored 1-like [Zingiber officinale]